MPDRKISTPSFLDRLAEQAPLRMMFTGNTREEWLQWRGKWLRKLRELMNYSRRSGRLVIRVLERIKLEGYVGEKVLYSRDRYSWMPAYLLIPDRAPGGEECAAVICAHGRDEHNTGKRAVAGLEDGYVRGSISKYNYDCAKKLALRGYVTIAPRTRGPLGRGSTGPSLRAPIPATWWVTWPNGSATASSP